MHGRIFPVTPPPLSPMAQRLLHIQMTLLMLASLLLLLSYRHAVQETPAYAALYYPRMIEYLAAGFVVSVGSVCLADALEREGATRK